MALKNIRYLLSDDPTTCEDLLIGLPVLCHLHVDTRTLLEDNTTSLHGTDCSLDDPETVKTGKLRRIMTTRLNRLQRNDAGGPAHQLMLVQRSDSGMKGQYGSPLFSCVCSSGRRYAP